MLRLQSSVMWHAKTLISELQREDFRMHRADKTQHCTYFISRQMHFVFPCKYINVTRNSWTNKEIMWGVMKIWERGKKHGDDPNVENKVGQVKSISKCSSFPFKAFQQILHFSASLEIEASSSSTHWDFGLEQGG